MLNFNAGFLRAPIFAWVYLAVLPELFFWIVWGCQGTRCIVCSGMAAVLFATSKLQVATHLWSNLMSSSAMGQSIEIITSPE
jgi:hypothetical protein